MDNSQDRISEMLKVLGNMMKCSANEELIEKMNTSLTQFVDELQNRVKNLPSLVLDEDVKCFIEEIKEDEGLSQEEFKEKYSYEMAVCRKLGRAGWVVSNHSNPREVKEWNTLLSENRELEIISCFEGENGHILENIFRELEVRYNETFCR